MGNLITVTRSKHAKGSTRHKWKVSDKRFAFLGGDNTYVYVYRTFQTATYAANLLAVEGLVSPIGLRGFNVE